MSTTTVKKGKVHFKATDHFDASALDQDNKFLKAIENCVKIIETPAKRSAQGKHVEDPNLYNVSSAMDALKCFAAQSKDAANALHKLFEEAVKPETDLPDMVKIWARTGLAHCDQYAPEHRAA